jgi:hypothetical protein
VNRITCDVLVAGGGVAGALAAVAAARKGAKTVLVEQEPYLGGTGYAGMFQHICGLYLNGDEEPRKTLNRGIVEEVVYILATRAPAKGVKKIGQVYVLPYQREDLHSVLLSLCRAEQELLLFNGSTAISLEQEQGTINTVTTDIGGATTIVSPSMVIDCTGDGSVASMAGAEFEIASTDSIQLAGFTIHVKGIKDPDESLAIKVPYYCAQGVNAGVLDPSMRFTTFGPGDEPDEGYCKLSIAGPPGAEREKRARNNANAVHHYLTSMIPEFKGSFIRETSTRVLDREGKRIRGSYVLTDEDVLAARKFQDGVVKNAWPIELWDASKGTVYKYVPKGDYYEVPFRCLMVKGFSNLLCAGRCISVTHEALGSTRVMGACMALGEQAGKAAAYRVKYGKYPENKF